MEKPEAFDPFTEQFFQDIDLVADNFDGVAAWAASVLSDEQRREVKQFIDALIESGDVKKAQRIWWRSKAEIHFLDEDILEVFRHMSAQLGSAPEKSKKP